MPGNGDDKERRELLKIFSVSDNEQFLEDFGCAILKDIPIHGIQFFFLLFFFFAFGKFHHVFFLFLFFFSLNVPSPRRTHIIFLYYFIDSMVSFSFFIN